MDHPQVGAVSHVETDDTPVLLFDGVCGFCNGVVHFILDNDSKGSLKFAPLQGDYGRHIKERFPELADLDSVVWVDREGNGQERYAIKSDAALRVTNYLGWPWRAVNAARMLPRPLRDVLYDLFARYRYRLFGKYDACMIPSKEIRQRFIEDSPSPPQNDEKG